MTRLKNVAALPPKGWNSWDCYGASVREEEVLGNAQYMADNLKEYGWEYVIVDIQWYEPAAKSSIYNAFFPLEMDEYSRLMPAVNRFPSAKDGQGFKPLGEKIHAMGLKFGIHIMRGIPRQAVHQNTKILGTSKTAREIAANSICPWNSDMYGLNPHAEGAQAYYDSIFAMYAEWGVDFVKVDDIATSRLYPFFKEEIAMMRQAIDKSGRDMVFSLSPGPAPIENGAFLKQHANMWRMTDDYWDRWDYLKGMFERCEKWWPFVGDHNWPDCDMLPLGHIGIRSVDGNWPHPWGAAGADRQTRFTPDEQRTMMTLWTIFRSPMFFGGELRDNDDFTLALLQDPTLTRMHQTITKSYPGKPQNGLTIWHAQAPSTLYTAYFNTTDQAVSLTTTPGETHAHGEMPAFVPPHGVVLTYR